MFYVSYYYAVSEKLYFGILNHNLMICLLRSLIFNYFFNLQLTLEISSYCHKSTATEL